jgi:hypothetical protein
MSRAHVHLPFVVGAAIVAAACGSAQSQSAVAGGDRTPPGGARATAEAFASAVTDADRARTLYGFDEAERHTFNYVPMVRGGLPLQDMSDAQKGQAQALLRHVLSDDGYARTQQIIAHEGILRALEMQRGVKGYERRDPGHYYLALFGTPAADAPWGWRFEGHHLSLNFSIAAGAITGPFGVKPKMIFPD